MTDATTIAFIGFGEAGSILGAGLAKHPDCRVRCYDVLLASADAEAIAQRAEQAAVTLCETLDAAIRDADWVVSAVTASVAPSVAQEAAARLGPGQIYLDINSVAPMTKQTAFAALQTVGARYVDVAVMAPVRPWGLSVPLLLAGPGTETVAEQLNHWGMSARTVSDTVGSAAAIKLCRSIMIKGLEALTLECLSTARYYHAEDHVLQSLAASFPDMGWEAGGADYLISRIAEHGDRRAAEMREAVRTVAATGGTPRMSLAVADTHAGLKEQMRAQAIDYNRDADFDWRSLLDALRLND